MNLEQGNVKFPPSFTLTVGLIGTSPAEEPAPRGWREEGPKGAKVAAPQPISSQYGRGHDTKESTPPRNLPSEMGSGEDAFLRGLQPIPIQVEAGKAG